MTSAGNPMGEAKDIFYSAVIGLSLALLSYLIVSTINPELLFTSEPGMAPYNHPYSGSANLPPPSCAYYDTEGFRKGDSPNVNRCWCAGDPDGPLGSQAPSDSDCEVPEKSEFVKDWCGYDILNCGKKLDAGDIAKDCKYGIKNLFAEKEEDKFKILKDHPKAEAEKYFCAYNCTFYDPTPPENPDDPDKPFPPNKECLDNCSSTNLSTCDIICETVVGSDCANKKTCCLHAELRASDSVVGIKTNPRWGTSGELSVKKGTTVYFNARDFSHNCKKPGPEGISMYAMDNDNIGTQI